MPTDPARVLSLLQQSILAAGFRISPSESARITQLIRGFVSSGLKPCLDAERMLAWANQWMPVEAKRRKGHIEGLKRMATILPELATSCACEWLSKDAKGALIALEDMLAGKSLVLLECVEALSGDGCGDGDGELQPESDARFTESADLGMQSICALAVLILARCVVHGAVALWDAITNGHRLTGEAKHAAMRSRLAGVCGAFQGVMRARAELLCRAPAADLDVLVAALADSCAHADAVAQQAYSQVLELEQRWALEMMEVLRLRARLEDKDKPKPASPAPQAAPLEGEGTEEELEAALEAAWDEAEDLQALVYMLLTAPGGTFPIEEALLAHDTPQKREELLLNANVVIVGGSEPMAERLSERLPGVSYLRATRKFDPEVLRAADAVLFVTPGLSHSLAWAAHQEICKRGLVAGFVRSEDVDTITGELINLVIRSPRVRMHAEVGIATGLIAAQTRPIQGWDNESLPGVAH